jgi:hypothetical protein
VLLVVAGICGLLGWEAEEAAAATAKNTAEGAPGPAS